MWNCGQVLEKCECFLLMIILDLLLENLFSIPASFCILGKAFWLFNFLFGIITIWIPISSVLKEKLVDWFPYDWLTRWQTFSSHGLMQVQINLASLFWTTKWPKWKCADKKSWKRSIKILEQITTNVSSNNSISNYREGIQCATYTW